MINIDIKKLGDNTFTRSDLIQCQFMTHRYIIINNTVLILPKVHKLARGVVQQFLYVTLATRHYLFSSDSLSISIFLFLKEE